MKSKLITFDFFTARGIILILRYQNLNYIHIQKFCANLNSYFATGITLSRIFALFSSLRHCYPSFIWDCLNRFGLNLSILLEPLTVNINENKTQEPYTLRGFFMFWYWISLSFAVVRKFRVVYISVSYYCMHWYSDTGTRFISP